MWWIIFGALGLVCAILGSSYISSGILTKQKRTRNFGIAIIVIALILIGIAFAVSDISFTTNVCAECESTLSAFNDWNFCPFCGADLEGLVMYD